MTHTIKLLQDGEVVIDGQTICTLTGREAEVFKIVMQARQPVKKDTIFEMIYRGAIREDKLIDVFVCRIREKLGKHRPAIETVWGRGMQRGAGYEAEIEAATQTVLVDAKIVDELVLLYDTGTVDEIVNTILRRHVRDAYAD